MEHAEGGVAKPMKCIYIFLIRTINRIVFAIIISVIKQNTVSKFVSV